MQGVDKKALDRLIAHMRMEGSKRRRTDDPWNQVGSRS